MGKRRAKSRSQDFGQVAAVVRAGRSKDGSTRDFRRQLVADFCKLLGDQWRAGAAKPLPDDLPPRLRQTLERLLAGDGEKQIAARLGISQHTVHQYVKSLYKRFDVSSRAELLARWVRT